MCIEKSQCGVIQVIGLDMSVAKLPLDMLNCHLCDASIALKNEPD